MMSYNEQGKRPEIRKKRDTRERQLVLYVIKHHWACVRSVKD